MIVTLSLFGAFRDFEPTAQVTLDVPDGARIADVRAALDVHGRAQWSGFRPGLLQVSAFASAADVLRDGDALPADGQLAILPPVSGG